jgi:succinyl-diaminopimelate desuccinylase
MTDPADPVALAQALIRCRSVTPADDGAIGLVAEVLQGLGFRTEHLLFEDAESPPIANLYARTGSAAPYLMFAGHTDVVPPCDEAAWSVDPFAGEVVDGMLYGRGAVDMKGAVACFLAATARFVDARRTAGRPIEGSIGFLITGDEVGPAINGTRKVLDWMKAEGELPDACLVGEPTNPKTLGEMIKIGRRGSLNGWLKVRGIQGHVAYPDRADNPLPRLLRMLEAIQEPLDSGTEHFQASSLVVTSVDVGNEASNVIPGEARARFNIRFNDSHTAESLEAWLRERLDRIGGNYTLRTQASGGAFVTLPGPFTEQVEALIERHTGILPELSTSGGTSDARFIKDVCPVIEFGLTGQTMHQIDERVSTADLEALTAIYQALLASYFGSG